MSEIKKALGLGEQFLLKSGATVNVVPCSIADLDDAQERWDKLLQSKFSLQTLFHPKNKDNADIQKDRETLEWLIIKASGQEVPEDENERKALAKPLLKPFNASSSGYGELLDYIVRFLGYFVGNTDSSSEEKTVAVSDDHK